MTKILICICTFNRNQSLIECLNSIKKLKDINYFDIKILILDNSSSNSSYKIIQNYKKKSNLNILQKFEKRRGVVNARNKCLKISKKIKPQYIAFIDDDCKVNKNWLKNIFHLLKKIDTDVITGPQKYDHINKNISDNYSSLFEKKYKGKIKRVKWAASNNVIFKYDILNKNNNLKFDKNLNKFGIGEDQLFFSLVSKKGYKIYWANNIFVTEKIHSHRLNINWIKSRSERLGILGHYIDIKLHGKIFGYLLNYIKSIYFFLLSLIKYLNFTNDNRKINFINYFFRFYGKLIGPFTLKKINFLK